MSWLLARPSRDGVGLSRLVLGASQCPFVHLRALVRSPALPTTICWEGSSLSLFHASYVDYHEHVSTPPFVVLPRTDSRVSLFQEKETLQNTAIVYGHALRAGGCCSFSV